MFFLVAEGVSMMGISSLNSWAKPMRRTRTVAGLYLWSVLWSELQRTFSTELLLSMVSTPNFVLIAVLQNSCGSICIEFGSCGFNLSLIISSRWYSWAVEFLQSVLHAPAPYPGLHRPCGCVCPKGKMLNQDFKAFILFFVNGLSLM